MHPSFRLCYITGPDRLSARPLEAILAEAVDAGIDLIQIRAKGFDARGIVHLAEVAVARARGTGSRVVINDRMDVALATGAAGVHLGNHSMPAATVRAIAPPNLLVGVSCHSLDEAGDAESAGADYILLGPVFETPSKAAYGPPLGLEQLSKIAACVSTPILALGGITLERVKACLKAGATGIAAIRLFEDAPSLARRVAELRSQFSEMAP
ncbi:MAG: thiamine phosphate synthase [Terriglobia bacterium]